MSKVKDISHADSDSETESKKSSRRTVVATNNAKNHISIFLRLRPLTQTEVTNKCSEAIKCVSETEVVATSTPNSLAHKAGDTVEHKFTFSKVFDANATQEQVFGQSVETNVCQLFNEGKNCMLVGFGCSGTGKSHTIHGSKEQPGLVNQIFRYLFNLIQENDKKSKAPDADPKAGHSYMVFVSYVEIYNEKIYDLFASTTNTNSQQGGSRRSSVLETRVPLKISLDKHKKAVINLKEIPISSFSQAIKYVELGNANRQSAATATNHASSRSHAMLTIKLARIPTGLSKETFKKNPEKYLQVSKFTLVDLAGNERVKRADTAGDRLVEGRNINLSLMVFSRCIEILKQNQSRETSRTSECQQVVPFRESVLTKLLQEYLVGNGKTVMIVCASPSSDDFDETINSLKFSAIARQVSNVQGTPSRQAKQSVNSNASKILDESKQTITELQAKIVLYENRFKSIEEKIRQEVLEDFLSRFQAAQTQFDQRLQIELREKEEFATREKKIFADLYQLQCNRFNVYVEESQKMLLDNDGSVTDDDEESTSVREELEEKAKQCEELAEKLKSIEQAEKENKKTIVALRIKQNGFTIEKEQLQEEVARLQNKLEKRKDELSNDEGLLADKHELNEATHRLEEIQKSERLWKSKFQQIDEENKRLQDQLEELQNINKILNQNLKTNSSNSGQNAEPVITPASTPSKIPTLRSIITPKKKIKTKNIPATIVHTTNTNSSGDVQMIFHGTVTPSLTGGGASVCFTDIEKVVSIPAKNFMNDDSSSQSTKKKEKGIPGSPILSELLDMSPLESPIAKAPTKKQPVAAKPKTLAATKKQLANVSDENVLNNSPLTGRKRSSSHQSFVEITLESESPVKKKVKRKPLQAKTAAKPAAAAKARPQRKVRNVVRANAANTLR